MYIIVNVNGKFAYIAHHFPPYHIEAAQTPVCVVSALWGFFQRQYSKISSDIEKPPDKRSFHRDYKKAKNFKILRFL